MGQRPGAHDRHRRDYQLRADRGHLGALVARGRLTRDPDPGGGGGGARHPVPQGSPIIVVVGVVGIVVVLLLLLIYIVVDVACCCCCFYFLPEGRKGGVGDRADRLDRPLSLWAMGFFFLRQESRPNQANV